MKKISMLLILLVVGCGGMGKRIDPTIPHEVYDNIKECQKLENYLSIAYDTYEEKKLALNLTKASNGLAFASGILFILPALMIDPTSKDSVNYENAIINYNYMLGLCQMNGCETGAFEPIIIEKKVDEAKNLSSGNYK